MPSHSWLYWRPFLKAEVKFFWYLLSSLLATPSWYSVLVMVGAPSPCCPRIALQIVLYLALLYISRPILLNILQPWLQEDCIKPPSGSGQHPQLRQGKAVLGSQDCGGVPDQLQGRKKLHNFSDLNISILLKTFRFRFSFSLTSLHYWIETPDWESIKMNLFQDIW